MSLAGPDPFSRGDSSELLMLWVQHNEGDVVADYLVTSGFCKGHEEGFVGESLPAASTVLGASMGKAGLCIYTARAIGLQGFAELPLESPER